MTWQVNKLPLYRDVGEEGPRLFWEQDITVSSSGIIPTMPQVRANTHLNSSDEVIATWQNSVHSLNCETE